MLLQPVSDVCFIFRLRASHLRGSARGMSGGAAEAPVTVLLLPGRVTLADWLDIYRGAKVALDPVARADVEVGAAALAAIRGGSTAAAGEPDPPASVAPGDEPPGEALSASVARLVVALKLASLAQGRAGVRWQVVEMLTECLGRDLLPVLANIADVSTLAGR